MIYFNVLLLFLIAKKIIKIILYFLPLIIFLFLLVYKDNFNTLYYNVLQAVYWFLLYFLEINIRYILCLIIIL